MPTENDNESNRRAAFRLDDVVTLKVRVLDESSYSVIAEDFSAFRLRYCMKSHIQNQRDIRKPKLIRIKKSSPDIAEYLESLELQITKLAERIDQVGEEGTDACEFTAKVNLSASGIRFRTDLTIRKGQMLEVGMMLGTSSTQVIMLGQVTRVEDRTDNKKAVSVHYTHIHPEDTEALVRHMARLQLLDLQSRRRA